jgi:hypothetical protein
MRFILGLILFLAGAWAVAAPTSTPVVVAEDEPQAEATPVDPAVVKIHAEVKKIRDAWDKARLEATVYEKRYRRAYDKWVQSAREGKSKALAHRDRAQAEFNLSVERRRLAWYRWEDARARQQVAEASARRKGLAGDIERVRARILDMEKKWGLAATPVPKPAP